MESGWRSKSGDNQVRKTLIYFSHTDLTWLSHLSGLVFHIPSGGFLARPPRRMFAGIGLELPAVLCLVEDHEVAVGTTFLLGLSS